MLSAWSRMSRDKQRAWIMVAGAITAGTILKVVYFRFSRGIMVDDSERRHLQGLEHLREAREFAEWSRKDREARLPKLTPEQNQQMNQYLRIVGEHGMSKAFSGEDCTECPIVGLAKTAKQAVESASTPSPTSDQ